MGISEAEVDFIAINLFGHTYSEERLKRVESRVPVGASPAAAGSIRGHVTRAMHAELRAALEQTQEVQQ